MGKSGITPASVYFGSLILIGAPALAFVLQGDTSDDDLREVLRISARISLAIYLVIFVARPLNELRPSAFIAELLRNRRLRGVGFAGVMTAHLWFIGWRWLELDLPVTARTLIFGGGAYLMLLLMLITSFDKPAQAIGRRNWKRLHRTGLYWLGLVFALTILSRLQRDPIEPLHFAEAILLVLAVVIRVVAFLRRHKTSAMASHR